MSSGAAETDGRRFREELHDVVVNAQHLANASAGAKESSDCRPVAADQATQEMALQVARWKRQQG